MSDNEDSSVKPTFEAAHSDDSEHSDSDNDEISKIVVPETSTLSSRLEKLKQLRKRLNESEEANRKDVIAEHASKKVNAKAEARRQRKRKEAEDLLEIKLLEESGVDLERKKAMEYSIEDVERWEEKQAKKAKRANTGFTDFTDLAHRKYARLTSQLKPDLESYGTQKLKASLSTDIVGGTEEQIYRDANSLAFVDGVGVKPSRDNVDKMVEDLHKQIETRGKSSRRRAYNPDEDITYINDRNRHFNKKISRAYDKYTQEIRDSFERGTAL